MSLSKQELENLMRLVGLTQDNEINCQRCLAQVAEFAELQLAGKTVPEGLKSVEQHLAICQECREEYDALQQALKDMGG